MNIFCSKCYNTFDESEMTLITHELYACPCCLTKIKNSTPREYTKDEVKEKLIKHLCSVLEYWYNETETNDTRDKMEGLLFTILSTLDGSSVDIPGFKLIPNIHSTDKDFKIKMGENWYGKKDIGGSLHELLNKYGPTEEERNKSRLKHKREQKLKRIIK